MAALALFTIAVHAQQPPAAPPKTPSPVPAPAAPPPYRFATGDTLDVKFDYVRDLNDSVKVRPDGFISLQRIGEVRVVGMTPADLTSALEQRYAAVIRQPDLTVIVRDFAVQQVFVGGEVAQPGIVALRGEVTCLQAILSTGGPKTTARLNNVALLRYVGEDKAEAFTLDLTKVIGGKAQDTVLQPFDVVVVPKTKIAKVDLFVEQFINGLMPRNIVFPYNLNTVVVNRVEQK